MSKQAAVHVIDAGGHAKAIVRSLQSVGLCCFTRNWRFSVVQIGMAPLDEEVS